MLDSITKAKKKYYPQTLLEEYKYEHRKIKIEDLIHDDLEKSSSNMEVDSDYSDEMESDDEHNE